jgi:hypothetical protein
MHGTSRVKLGGGALMNNQAGWSNLQASGTAKTADEQVSLTKRNRHRSICSKSCGIRMPFAAVDF